MTRFIYLEVERILKKYGTRNPYELLEAIGAVTKFSNEYEQDGLKGYSTILNRTKYAVINGKLSDEDKFIVAGHEASHLIIHRDAILASPVKMMRDFNIFDNSGRYEREANTFLADFLVSDKDVLDVISSEEQDYFSTASELCLPAPLFAFKLYNMMRRGYELRSPVDLDSCFLAKTWQAL